MTTATNTATAFEPWQPTRLTALRRPLRFPAAALLLAVAGIHVPIIGQHLREAPYIGALFILLAILSTMLAVLLVTCDSAAVWLAAAAVAIAAIVAYVLSRSTGLPQIGDDIGNWFDPLGIVALTVETLAAVTAIRVLRTRSQVHARS